MNKHYVPKSFSKWIKANIRWPNPDDPKTTYIVRWSTQYEDEPKEWYAELKTRSDIEYLFNLGGILDLEWLEEHKTKRTL